jgi:hypothetical protein
MPVKYFTYKARFYRLGIFFGLKSLQKLQPLIGLEVLKNGFFRLAGMVEVILLFLYSVTVR